MKRLTALILGFLAASSVFAQVQAPVTGTAAVPSQTITVTIPAQTITVTVPASSAPVTGTAAVPAPPPVVTPPPVTPPAADAKTALLNYLVSLSSAGTKHILTGQHVDYWTPNPMGIVTPLSKAPAIIGTTWNIVGNPGIDGVGMSNAWLNAGGIVQFSWWAGNPKLGVNSLPDTDRNIYFPDLLNPATQTYKNFYATLDNLAAKLKAINGPVLFRPFFEVNGGWFWWGNQDPAAFKQVWIQMRAYLESKGVNNLLWVFNVNGGVGGYTTWYPGAAYVDIVSFDSYGPSASNVPMYNDLAALGKPIIIAETGVAGAPAQPPLNSASTAALLQTVKQNFPKVVAVIPFAQNWALIRQQGADAFLNDPAVINRAELPAGLH